MPLLKPTHYDNYIHSEITDLIIKAFYKVYNTLGHGFLEKVYEKSMKIELQNSGLRVFNQQPIKVYYNNIVVGTYFSDLTIEELVIVEIKAGEQIASRHECQLVNYLKATNKEVGLLLNFGPIPSFKRKVFMNEFK